MWTAEMHTGFWCGKITDRDNLEDLGSEGRKLAGILKEHNGRVWM